MSNVCSSAAATAREIVAPAMMTQRLSSAAAAELDGGHGRNRNVEFADRQRLEQRFSECA